MLMGMISDVKSCKATLLLDYRTLFEYDKLMISGDK